MQIVQFPHPALRWKSKPIIRITDELKSIVREMFDLMYTADGIGLAANQVGLPYRVFVLNLTADPKETEEELVFINPEITYRKGTVEAEEGCLSFPKLYKPVRRAAEVKVEFFDLQGKGYEIDADDLLSRAIQHELDHLDGVLFTDRLTDIAQKEVAGTLADFESQLTRQQETGALAKTDALVAELQRLEKSPLVFR